MSGVRLGGEQPVSERLLLFSRFAAIVVVVGGAAVMHGWWWHIGALKTVLPNLVAMQPNTAVCFVLLGYVLWLSNGRAMSPQRQWWTAALAGLVVIITGTTLLEYLLSTNWGVDQWLFLDDTRSTQTSHPGRMAPITAIALNAQALAMVCMTLRPTASRALSSGVLIIGLLGINGYLFGIESLYSVPLFRSLAFHTAVLLVLLSLGALVAAPMQHAMAFIVSESVGGASARALTLTIPMVLGALSGLTWLGLQWQWFDTAIGLAFFVVIGMALSVFIGQRVARDHAATDAAKDRIQSELHGLNQRLEQTVAQRTATLLQLNTDLQAEMGERKTSEQALRTALDLLEYSQTAAKVGGWQLNIATGRLYWTAETYRIHETSPEEFNPTVEAYVGYFLPESRQRIALALQAAMERGEGYALELETLTTKGTRIDVFTTCTVTMVEGKAVTLTGIFQDITELKNAQRVLGESQGRLAGVIESAMDAIVSVDSAHRIVLFNSAAEKMFGRATADMIGQPLDQLIPEKFRAGHSQHISHYGSTVSTSRAMGALGQLNAIRANGEEFPIEASISQMASNGEKIFTVIVRDITQRQAAERALLATNADLARSNAELEQFAHVASHDLQEPLRSISSSVQLLQHRYKGALDARADEFIAHAVGGVQRMQMVIDDLLAYSRISAAPQVMRVIDLNAALQVARANLSGAIAASHALISHDELPSLMANPVQISQLFQNLLANALKFRGAKPATVHVGARQDGAEWVISVADQGIGIEPQYFGRIFKLFQRLHSRTEYAGTGIGLTICQKIVERHGGRIWVESVPGQGTTFYFTLPIH